MTEQSTRSLYIPKAMREKRVLARLDKLAKAQGTSGNALAVNALDDYLDRHEALSTGVRESLSRLEDYRGRHLELAVRLMNACGGALYMMDFLVAATLNRSISLLRAFCSLLEEKNFMTAASVLRLQLDNVLRLFAAWIVTDPKEFIAKIMEGVPIRKLKDRDNKLMTDGYLVKKMSEEQAWIKRLYKGTCGYVHLSEKHFVNTFKPGGKRKAISVVISGKDAFVTDTNRVEAIRAFEAVTQILLKYVEGWIFTKSNPDHPLVIAARKKVLKEAKED